MDATVKLLLITVVIALVIACLGGILVGKYLVRRQQRGARRLLSKKERIIYAACVLAGCVCIAVGVLYKPAVPTMEAEDPGMYIEDPGMYEENPDIAGDGAEMAEENTTADEAADKTADETADEAADEAAGNNATAAAPLSPVTGGVVILR